MMVVSRSAVRTLSGVALAAAVSVTAAQTPAQLEYERQQREYWRQQEQQRQEQQRQQQLMQDNARRQQEESSRLNAPSGQGQAPGGAPTTGAQGRAADPTGAQAYSAARATWEKRPALPPDRNPLLGKWQRPPSTRPNPSDPFGAVTALAKGGLCEALFGGGVFEFRTDRLVGIDERSREQELDRVEYRGDSKHVIVLPKTTLKLMDFDVEGPDRINWAGQKCVLVRVGAASSGRAAAAAPATAATAAPSSSASGGGSKAGGVLAFSVGEPSPENKVVGRKLIVLKQDPQVALIQGGLKSTPYASVLQNWLRACVTRAPECEKGARVLQPFTVGVATTDATGHAQTPELPAGRYWVLSDAMVGGKRLMWHELVDMTRGNQSLTLDQRNAKPVD